MVTNIEQIIGKAGTDAKIYQILKAAEFHSGWIYTRIPKPNLDYTLPFVSD